MSGRDCRNVASLDRKCPANDVSFDAIFAEQLKNFAQPGDVVLGISGSGNSPNVLRAMEYANSIGCRTIALTGRNGGQLGPMAQLEIRVPIQHMGRIEDGHMIVCHMIGYHFMDSCDPANVRGGKPKWERASRMKTKVRRRKGIVIIPPIRRIPQALYLNNVAEQ